MKKLSTLSILFLFLFTATALAQQGTFVAPAVQAPQPQDAQLVGRWHDWEVGTYTVARDNDTVLIVSTWDELVDNPDKIIDWRRGGFKKDAPPVAAKLVTKLMDTPGIVNVIIAKHRCEVYRANVYDWASLLPKIADIFNTSELKKGP